MYVRTKTFNNKDGSSRTYLYIVEGKRVNGLVRTELEGMAYEGFRALGMRVPGRVLEAGEGEEVVERGGSASGNR